MNLKGDTRIHVHHAGATGDCEISRWLVLQSSWSEGDRLPLSMRQNLPPHHVRRSTFQFCSAPSIWVLDRVYHIDLRSKRNVPSVDSKTDTCRSIQWNTTWNLVDPIVAIHHSCQMPYYQQMLSRLEFFLAAHDNPAKTCKGELCDFCQQEWITTL